MNSVIYISPINKIKNSFADNEFIIRHNIQFLLNIQIKLNNLFCVPLVNTVIKIQLYIEQIINIPPVQRNAFYIILIKYNSFVSRI